MMLSFQLNKMTYVSNQLFLYMPTEVSVHHLFIFLPVYHAHLPANSSACPHTHRATYPRLNVAAHFDAFLPANHENLPVDSTAHPHTHGCNRFSFYLFILKLSFRLTANTYLPTHLRHYVSTATPPPHTHTPFLPSSPSCMLILTFPFRLKMNAYLTTYLLGTTYLPENESTCSAWWFNAG